MKNRWTSRFIDMWLAKKFSWKIRQYMVKGCFDAWQRLIMCGNRFFLPNCVLFDMKNAFSQLLKTKNWRRRCLCSNSIEFAFRWISMTQIQKYSYAIATFTNLFVMYSKKRHSQTMATVFNSKICTALSWIFDFCDSAIKQFSHFESLISTQMPDYIFHWKSQALWESKKKIKTTNEWEMPFLGVGLEVQHLSIKRASDTLSSVNETNSISFSYTIFIRLGHWQHSGESFQFSQQKQRAFQYYLLGYSL